MFSLFSLLLYVFTDVRLSHLNKDYLLTYLIILTFRRYEVTIERTEELLLADVVVSLLFIHGGGCDWPVGVTWYQLASAPTWQPLVSRCYAVVKSVSGGFSGDVFPFHVEFIM